VTSPITAGGKHVIVIGGGDTAADCLARRPVSALRRFTQLIMPRPRTNALTQPWPPTP